MSYSTPVKVRGSGSRQVITTPPSAAATDGAPAPVSNSGGERKARTEKVFTEEDEIQLLNSMLKIAKSPSSSAPRVVKIDSTIFNLIGKSLKPKSFTRKQLDDKFRRLHIKYRKLAKSRSSIKNPHDRQIYEIGRMLWSKNGSRVDRLPVTEGNGGAVEKVESSGRVDLRKYPVLMEECEKSLEGGVWRGIMERGLGESKVREMNDKLVMLRYEEATVMAKKAKLVQELTALILSSVTSSRKV